MPMKPPADHESDRDRPDGEESAIDAAVAAEDESASESEHEELEAELAAQRDRVLRLQAEMENLRGRTARELSEQRKYAAIDLARDLLPVVDNVDRAIEAAEKSEESSSLLEGFQMVRQQLTNVLAQHHCIPIEAEGEAFDPQFHEAILQQPSTEVPANHVVLVTQIGYHMHDRVVRPAQVIVSGGPPDEE